MLNKKSQISQQFNWIFAILAGAVIIMFFIFVIGQIKLSSEAKLSAKVLNNFDAILSGSSASPETLSRMETTSLLKFSVNCEKDGFSEIRLEKGSSSVPITQKPVYSPGKIDAEMLFIYTLPIKKPFYSGNSLLISDSKTMFVFFGNQEGSSSYIKSLYNYFPDNISKDHTGYFKEKYKEYNKVIVLSTQDPPALNSADEKYEGQNILKDININWLKIKTGDNKIEFYEKRKKEKNLKNIGEIENIFSRDYYMLAAFSKDPVFYRCNLKKISKRLNIISKIYKKRAEKLLNKNTECSVEYQDAISLYQKIEKSDIPLEEKETIKKLKNTNQALLMKSCPLIY
ncbi:MAG: hypothetical protein ACQER9_01830 [Nanobdellota archaeon]